MLVRQSSVEMEKEKLSRKKSIDVKNLPAAPEIPTVTRSTANRPLGKGQTVNDPFASLYDFKDRESAFLKSLKESINLFDSENCDASTAAMSNEVNRKSCEDECLEFVRPLMSRTQESISALLATRDSLDQLDNLHRIVKQLLSVQEQNYQIRKRLRTVKTIHALKSMEIQVSFKFLFIFSWSLGHHAEKVARIFIVNILKEWN